MPKFPKRLLVPAVALSLGFTLSSCSSDEPAAEQPAAAAESTPSADASDVETYSIGESVTVAMSEGNVATVTITAVDYPETVEGMNKTVVSPEEGRFVRLDVTWKTEEGVTDAHSTQFGLEDKEGRFTNPHSITTDINTLWIDDVAAGEEVRGYATFDTREGAQTIRLTDPNREDLAYFELPE